MILSAAPFCLASLLFVLQQRRVDRVLQPWSGEDESVDPLTASLIVGRSVLGLVGAPPPPPGGGGGGGAAAPRADAGWERASARDLDDWGCQRRFMSAVR